MKHPRYLYRYALAAAILAAVYLPRPALSRILLLDGALELTGYVRETAYIRTHIPRDEKQFHKSNVDFSLSSGLLEGLYRFRDDEVKINLFSGVTYWYEKAPVYDAQLRHGIPSQVRSSYAHPQDDKYIREAYLDISRGPLRALIGKQIVVWGETDIVRTADVVNPLDLRYSLPGIDTWDEIKIGLWMIRAFYNTGLPGDLLLEALFVPGDFQYLRLPYEGTHWGVSPAETSPSPGNVFGYSHWLLEKMIRDAPGWNLHDNYEFGLRLRGYTLDIDWTFIYFNTLSDIATENPARSLQFRLDYVRGALPSILFNQPSNPHFPGYDVYRYKRYQVIGGTAQTIAERLWGSVWRLEWFYEIGQHFNKAKDGQVGAPAYDEVKRDSCGAGLNYSDKFTLPYVTHRWCNDKQLEASITLYYEKIIGYDRDIVVDFSRGHRSGDSYAAMVIWNFVQPIQHDTWMFIFAGTYNPNGMYFLLPMLSYGPGNHWRVETGAALFGDRSDRARHFYRDKDSMILRLRYEW